MQENLSLGPDSIRFQKTKPPVRLPGIPFLSNQKMDLPLGNVTQRSSNKKFRAILNTSFDTSPTF